MPFYERGDVRIHYEEAGSGFPLLVTPGGGICITEYVFSSALEQLALWPEELFLQFGVLAPAGEDGQAVFDARTTVIQLGVVALSVLLERSLTLQDFDHRLEELVEEFVTNASGARKPSLLIAPLRTWLRHALQLTDPGYASAAEAEKGLAQALAAAGPEARAEIDAAPFPAAAPPRLVAREEATRDEPPRSEATSTAIADTVAAPTAAKVPSAVPASSTPIPTPSTPARAFAQEKPVAAPQTSVPPPTVAPPQTYVSPQPFVTPQSTVPPHTPVVAPAARVETAHAAPPYLTWGIAILAVVALAEAAFIGRLLTRNQPAPTQASVTIESSQPGTTVMVDGRPAGATPVKLDVTGQTRAIRVIPSEQASTTPPAVTASAANSDAEKTAAEAN